MIQLDADLPVGTGPPGSDGYVLARQLLGSARRLLPGSQRGEEVNSPASAIYCYSVWLRHMALASAFGPYGLPRRTVVELGPGGSLGVGLAALLHGAESYLALDTTPFIQRDRHHDILDDLVELFGSRAPVPAGDQFPNLKPFLLDYRYPCGAGEPDLSPGRVAAIHDAIDALSSGRAPTGDGPSLRYFTDYPCFDAAMGRGRADLIISQAVMEYLPDLDAAYADQHGWLRPGGWISHQIDLSAHETAATWNGHWAIPAPLWEMLRRTRPTLINRQPFSGHTSAMEDQGFAVLMAVRSLDRGGVPRERLAPGFRGLSREDRQVRGAWIMAKKS